MLIPLLLLAAGLYLLYKGSSWLVESSSDLARHHGVTTLVIGLTIVAFGTSTPEIMTVFVAAAQGDYDVAMGNIVGSNIANICLVLGLTAVIRPVTVRSKTLKRELPFAAGTALLLWWFASNGVISMFEGIILSLIAVIFTLYMVYVARSEKVFDEAVAQVKSKLMSRTSGRHLGMMLIGIIALVAGAKLLVDSAVDIATQLQISPYVIAVTIVAIGTSLPELSSSVVAAIKRHNDIALGNVIGSNILNILVGLGLPAIFFPIAVSASIIAIDIPLMVGVTFLIWLMLRTSFKLTRLEGLALLILYTIYIFGVVV